MLRLQQLLLVRLWLLVALYQMQLRLPVQLLVR